MKGFSAFLHKEIMELLRGYKALILFLIFLLFGLMSPVLAKIMPDVLSKISTGNISIAVSPSTYLNAYAQFFKNVTQLGFVVLLLLFATSLSHEISSGTLIMPLSKGLSRNAVILSKFVASLSLWTLCYVCAALVHIGYTFCLFGMASAPHLFFSMFSLYVFGVFLLALLLFCSTLIDGSFGGLLLCVGLLAALLALNIFPGFKPYSPLFLASQNSALLALATEPRAMFPSLAITCSLTTALLLCSLLFFRKREL